MLVHPDILPQTLAGALSREPVRESVCAALDRLQDFARRRASLP
jgi:hypothetical protein